MNRASQPTTNSPITLINVFEVPTEHVDAFIAGWAERAALMSTKPGFLDTRLHRASAGCRPGFSAAAVRHPGPRFIAAGARLGCQRALGLVGVRGRGWMARHA